MMPFGSNVAPSWLPSKSFFLEFDDHDAIVNSDGESWLSEVKSPYHDSS